MSVLTGPDIAARVAHGGITIAPFDPANVGPNSYDLTLSPDLLVYANNYLRHLAYEVSAACGTGPRKLLRHAGRPTPLDTAAAEPTVPLTIPPDGLVLWPGVLYLGSTVERTATPDHLPCLSGRSTVGRYGIGVHVTAGFGDVGFGCGPAGPCSWTLEVTAVVPVRVYAKMRICQIYYTTVHGERRAYAGSYNAQTGPKAAVPVKRSPGKD